MRLFKADFKDRELDILMAKWISGSLSEGERQEWVHTLSYDKRFREYFCEWIKSLRNQKNFGKLSVGRSR